MPDFLLSDSAVWYWFAFGVIALIIEAFLPDLLPMGLSFASFIFAIICWLFPGTYSKLELGHFLILATVVIVASYFVVNPFLYGRQARRSTVTDLSDNRRNRLVGSSGAVSAAIRHGVGRADVDGVSWKCRGSDLPLGTPIIVTGILGNTLAVEKLHSQPALARRSAHGPETGPDITS